jgi:hypothetical protein
MAVLTIFSLYRQLSPRIMPHLLGLELESPQQTCEIDIALALDDLGAPIVILGEVKSQNPVDVNDLANLAKIQQYLRSKNIECFILAATLQDRFQPEELTALRRFCENPPVSVYRHHGGLEPILPIVFTNRDLSAPQYSDENPIGWLRPNVGGAFGMFSLAIESCRRNLGLTDISPTLSAEVLDWDLTWDRPQHGIEES